MRDGIILREPTLAGAFSPYQAARDVLIGPKDPFTDAIVQFFSPSARALLAELIFLTRAPGAPGLAPAGPSVGDLEIHALEGVARDLNPYAILLYGDFMDLHI